jgi:hypothetical protein
MTDQKKKGSAWAKGKGKGKPKAKARSGRKPAASAGARKGKTSKPKMWAFDATNSALPKSLLPVGDAVAVPSVIRTSVSAGINNRIFVFMTNCGGTGTFGAVVKLSPRGSPSVTQYALTMLNAAVLADDATSGGPTSSKPASATLEVCNVTKRLDVGGKVYSLVLDQRLVFPGSPIAGAEGMTLEQWHEMFDSLVQHPKTKSHSGENYTKPKKHSSVPVDNTDYDNFFQHRGVLNFVDFAKHIGTWPNPGSLLDNESQISRAMSTIILMVDTPPADATYEFSAHAQTYTRWPVTTVTGRLMKPVPVGDQRTVVAERSGGTRGMRDSRGDY